MVPAESAPRLRVELVWSPVAGDVRHQWLDLAAGCTLGQALSGCEALAGVDLAGFRIGIWGRVRPLDTPLRERDRIELYRPLTVDPKEARRQRYRATGRRIVSRHRPKAGAI